MLIAHRVELDPTDGQRTGFARVAGTARCVYDWALDEWRCRDAPRRLDPTLPAPMEAAFRRDLNVT